MISTYEFWAYSDVFGRFDGEHIRVYGRDQSYWAEHPKLGHRNAPSPDDAINALLDGWHWRARYWFDATNKSELFNWSAVT